VVNLGLDVYAIAVVHGVAGGLLLWLLVGKRIT